MCLCVFVRACVRASANFPVIIRYFEPFIVKLYCDSYFSRRSGALHLELFCVRV